MGLVVAVDVVFWVCDVVVAFLDDVAFEEVAEAVLFDEVTDELLPEDTSEEELVNIEETLSNILPPWVVHCGI